MHHFIISTHFSVKTKANKKKQLFNDLPKFVTQFFVTVLNCRSWIIWCYRETERLGHVD